MDKKKNKKNWVDFNEVKSKVSIKDVLEHYGVELKQSGQNHTACCPIHKGTNPKQFSVNFDISNGVVNRTFKIIR